MATSLPRKIDLRLVAGLLLVILSILGVSFLISQGKQTQSVYIATVPISTGHKVTEADFEVVEVALGDATSRYLGPGQLEPGHVANQSIAAGELLPVSAVSKVSRSSATSVVVELATPLPQGIELGSKIDLWSAMAAGQGVFATPTVLVESAELIDEIEPEGITAFEQGTMVELLIPQDSVAAVLEAQANKDAMSVVPALIKSTKAVK